MRHDPCDILTCQYETRETAAESQIFLTLFCTVLCRKLCFNKRYYLRIEKKRRLNINKTAGCKDFLSFFVSFSVQPLLPKAGSRLLVLVLGVVARSYVDGPTSPDTSSDCRQYIKEMLAIFWTIKLALLIKTSSSLAIGSSRVQASRLTELQ